MDPQERLDELVREVRTMRKAQTKYGGSRTTTAHSEARYHEGVVDVLLAKLPQPDKPPIAVQGSLF